MNDTQKALRKVTTRLGEIEKRSAEIMAGDIEDAQDAELRELAGEKAKLLGRRDSINALLDAEDQAGTVGDVDAEHRERLELRSRASLTNYIKAAIAGRDASGVEAELSAAEEVEGIPFALFEPDPREERAVAGIPGTVGVNLQPIFPAVFAESVIPSLRVQMPRVMSGTYATARISTSQTAGAYSKGTATMATAAAFAVASAAPKRVSARLELAIEDIASVGAANYEAALRENLQMALSDELDDQGLNGNGTAPNLRGILAGMADPTDPSNIATFDDFISTFADQVDGLWAMTGKDVSMLAGAETYRLGMKTFRDDSGDSGAIRRGAVSFSDYAMAHFGGFRTNERMPAVSSDVQTAIVSRMGRPGMTVAVCPTWGEIMIDDVYSGSASGTKAITAHVLLGDVIIIQPGAYARVDFKVS